MTNPDITKALAVLLTPAQKALIAAERRALRVLRSRVAHGADLLDATMPDWHTRVENQTLRMENGSSCILGQTFKEWANGLNGYEVALEHFVGYYAGEEAKRFAVDNGFLSCVDVGRHEDFRFDEDDRAVDDVFTLGIEYGNLALLWQAEITVRDTLAKRGTEGGAEA